MFKIVVLLVGLLLSNHAFSAGFDCKKATSSVEKLICSNDQLGKQDEALNQAHKQLIKQLINQVPAREALLKSQREWLAARELCETIECVSQAYTNRLAQLTELAEMSNASWLLYQDDTLGISFSYPSGYQVQPCHPMETACVAVIDLSAKATDKDYQLKLNISEKGLKQSIKEAGFERKDGKWINTLGGSEPVEASLFSVKGLYRIKANIQCGKQKTDSCQYLWALISNGKRSVVASTQEGNVKSDTDTKILRMLESIKFE